MAIQTAAPSAIGHIVLYTYGPSDTNAFKRNGAHDLTGQVRPAVIVREWPNEFGEGQHGYNIQVFTDGGNDGFEGTRWVTSVRLADQSTPGCISYKR